jgi:hypothetical protein
MHLSRAAPGPRSCLAHWLGAFLHVVLSRKKQPIRNLGAFARDFEGPLGQAACCELILGHMKRRARLSTLGTAALYISADQRHRSRCGELCGQDLKGANPDDLPMQQPTAFELIVNGKTAKTSASQSVQAF